MIPDLSPIIDLFTQLNPQGVAVVALFMGIIALITYFTRDIPSCNGDVWLFYDDFNCSIDE